MSKDANFTTFLRIQLQAHDIVYFKQIYADANFSSMQKHILAKTILVQIVE
jgi:hypothetical protein